MATATELGAAAASPTSNFETTSPQNRTNIDHHASADDTNYYEQMRLLCDFKTRSIEQIIMPLVALVSKLMQHRDRPFRCDRNPGVLARVGQGVNLAVERFVTVAETIADDNPDVKQDMYEACKEARVAGSTIEKLCECAIDETLMDREAVVRAAKGLLGAVTRVLLLADITVVKQLLMAKDKVARSLGRLESVSNFTEFVKAFSQFGAEMVELAHMTGDRQNDLKDERRRAQMAAARQVLERSTMMLLTSSKACLRHPDCPSAKENRDTVFCQMRRAMDLIHYVVKDGVLESSESTYSNSQSPQQEDWDSSTVFASLKQFERLVESTRVTLLSAGCRDALTTALDVVIERTQDFTDSAYTSHEHRENILLLCDRAKLELNALLRVGNSINFDTSSSASPNTELDQAILGVLRATRDLRQQLCQTTMEQAGDLGQVTKAGQELALTIRNVALATDIERLQESSDRFHEYLEHILEVCKLLRHVALSESLQVSAKFTEINLRIYGPQVVTAAHTLSRHPTSKIAMENLEVFADMWQWLMSDVTTVAKDVLELCQNRPEKQVYMSLPRPGKHGTTSKPLKPVRLDSEEQAKIAKSGLEMKRITTEMDAETEKWQGNGTQPEHENNDIVKRAKNMSSMAFSMYQFTRGEGALKTTQDLFTQAEYFAEEANRLYKVVRQFSYQVPGGPHKKELLENLDRVPTYVQQLQFTVKNPTVGKAATFVKVDNVIQETKNLMNVISKVVTTCFVCATKYNLDFRGLSARGAGGSPYRGGDGSGADGDGSGAGGDGSKVGSAPGSDPSV
ncbi:alpha-catulin isoform X1 [Trichogramma pretiosum]|uniref:alpha-catulin isoform X1 n=1 Tax=Trichogramma pretiosum TaxID=7493 RepID=UPI0006C9E04D|nr:alpha-catulin isoform X1 [Trichogramma pretiosum]